MSYLAVCCLFLIACPILIQTQSANSCSVAGYSRCCEADDRSCRGSLPSTCFCDAVCQAFNDCCSDIFSTCSAADNPYLNGSRTYLLFTDGNKISVETFDSDGRTLLTSASGDLFAIAVDIRRNLVYYSNDDLNTISQADLDTGQNAVEIANTGFNGGVADLAVDWIANNLYRTELRYRRIVVHDLDTGETASLIQAAADETFRSIALDPTRKVMFFSGWSGQSSIQRASMDGSNKVILHSTGTIQPNDIALDITNQLVYWTDGYLSNIQYSNYSGLNRGVLTSIPNSYLFGITLDAYLVIFGEWGNNTIRFLHKLDDQSPVRIINDNLTTNAGGITLVNPDIQPAVSNSCPTEACSHVCVLSSTAPQGYSCLCPDGLTLDSNQMDCTGAPMTVSPPPEATCNSLRITTCCSNQVCGSSCYCDTWCRYRGDCCTDVDTVCPIQSSSCQEAGFTGCCERNECEGISYDIRTRCFCDLGCGVRGDCCDDINSTCPMGPPVTTPSPRNELPFLQLNMSTDILTEAIGHFDDGASHAIHIPNGFPFDGTSHTIAFIGTNGIISFDQPVYSAASAAFPTTRNDIRNLFIVAPFWDDVDIRRAGNIIYEVHTASSGNVDSLNLISQVSSYIEGETGEQFFGTWMLVVQWDMVHPWPHGEINPNPFILFFFPDYVETNSLQAVLVTNGTASYTVFTYKCGALSWSRNSIIGYNAAGQIFENHPQSGRNARNIACSNAPISNWTNVLYNLTGSNVTITQPPTIEPPQMRYLAPLPFLGVNSSGVLSQCENCTSGAIELGTPGIPFGNYYHERVYVSVNGIISFDREFSLNSPENFPSMDGDVYFSYLVAPYWSNIDTRREGTVRYETYRRGDSDASDAQINLVVEFLQEEENVSLVGEWMLLASWEGVHPYPHGEAASLSRENPYLESTNSFQAVIISNLTKTYTIFIYSCDQVTWSDEATIGFNAAGDYYMNHNLSGRLQANAIDCVHSAGESVVLTNNVVYDLVPTSANASTPIPPPSSLGSCDQAGYTDCCDTGVCLGSPGDCMCDEFCHIVGDCCSDIATTCDREPPENNDTYLLFANRPYINRINVNGDFFHIISAHEDQIILGIDYDYRREYIYWSDARNDQLYRSNFDGSSIMFLANATHEDIEDIALDWVANNLYWTESVTGNIEVLDLDLFERAVILNTGANSIPRGIALDPATREIFWTDWGSTAKIEKASMDGSNRQVLHSTGLVWPNGITLDYAARRVYWVDAFLDRIQHCRYDGTDRVTLISNLDHPFAVTIEGNLIFWTDWSDNSVRVAHKQLALGVQVLREFLRARPYGIEAVTPTRQANAVNPCPSSGCSHLCLLSSSDSRGYRCLCPRGYELQSDGTTCRDVGTVRPPPAIGSCVEAGYTSCCSSVLFSDFCVGSAPFNCFCDLECRERDDCCPDIAGACPMGGSCVNAGYQACCSFTYSSNFCRGDDNVCMCDDTCSFFGDCCTDQMQLCPGIRSSCAAANYTSCCTSGDCFGATPTCKCDAACRTRGDCCFDIETTCSALPVTTPTATEATPETTEMQTTMSMTTPTPTPSQPPSPQTVFLPFISLDTTVGVETFHLPRSDDESLGVSIPNFFLFGSSLQSSAYINTNGIISFNQPFTFHNPTLFPSSSSAVKMAYLLAPFWSDVDTTLDGEVRYEVHASNINNDGSDALLDEVNDFISNYTGTVFSGAWMLVAEWSGVHPYPGTTTLSNTYQAIAITNNTRSFAVFTYRCGLMNWSGEATIGYNDFANNFYNHPFSGGVNARNIACVNSPVSPWSNVVLDITANLVVTPPPPTITPSTNNLPFIDLPEDDSVVLEPCYSCSSAAINLTDTPFPFGANHHTTAYVNVDGVISFSSNFRYQPPSLFPGDSTELPHLSFAVAPFWANLDNRPQGQVRYKTYKTGESSNSDDLLGLVSDFVNNQTSSIGFAGSWMLVTLWDGLQEFKRVDNPLLSSTTNTFQAITISNGTKSYAVFTYRCNTIQWSGAATIGFNAGGSYHSNHPYSGTINTDYIDCFNSPASNWTNLVYDLVPDPSSLSDSTPIPPPRGLCRPAFEICCDLDGPMACAGYSPADCFCDRACMMFGDCCGDYDLACPSPESVNDTFLLVSDSQSIKFFNPRDQSERAVYNTSLNAVPGNIMATDYDSIRGYVYFYESGSNFIRRVDLDGSNVVDLIAIGSDTVGGLAVDWVANNIYWTDSSGSRIQVMDLDSVQRKTLIKTGQDSVPGAITVDPATSYIIWINGGPTLTIERASLDGSDRHTLHSTRLTQPSGITMDYAAQKIYWTDTSRGIIESSYYDASRRQQLISLARRNAGVAPVSISLERRVVYWTDLTSNVVFATNKEAVNDRSTVVQVYVSSNSISSIISLSPYRQNRVQNPCNGNNCSHLCLPSSTADVGYTCACPDESLLMNDSLSCMLVPSSSSVLPSPTSTSTSVAVSSTSIPPGASSTRQVQATTSHPLQATSSITTSRLVPTKTSTPVVQPPSTTTPAQASTSTAQLISTSTAKAQPMTSSTKPVQVTTSSQTMVAPSSTPTTPMPTSSPPPTVTNLQVFPVNENQIRVSWTGIPGVVVYLVQVSNYSGGITAMTLENYVSDTSYSQLLSENIGPYIPYKVAVTGYSTEGVAISETIESTFFFTREGVPLVAPNVDTPQRTSNSAIKLTWKELTPDKARGFVTNYTIGYQKVDAGKTRRQANSKDGGVQVVNPMSTQAIIDNLDEKSAYTVSMWANTTAGRGKATAPFTVDAFDGATPQSHSGVNTGAIGGGVVAVVVLLAFAIVIVMGILWFLRRRNKVKNMNYEIFDESEDREDDQAKILATSFKSSAEDSSGNSNPMTKFDNPVYDLTEDTHISPTLSFNEVAGSDPESEMAKEDLSMIGKALFEDDIEL